VVAPRGVRVSRLVAPFEASYAAEIALNRERRVSMNPLSLRVQNIAYL
jgi:hypothetical protein